LGAGLLLAHPVPVVLARETTGLSPAAVFVPFAAEKLAFTIAISFFSVDYAQWFLLLLLPLPALEGPLRCWLAGRIRRL
jgi:hypothetical protein